MLTSASDRPYGLPWRLLARPSPAATRDQLIPRVEAAGLPTRRLDPHEQLPYDYLSEGVCLYRGELLWAWGGYRPATLDAFCHEAGHALQLSVAERAEWSAEDMRTEEATAMVVQVELTARDTRVRRGSCRRGYGEDRLL